MHSLGGVKEELKEQLISDYKTADLSDEDKLILGYADKLTTEAYTVDRAYVDFLKSKGLSEHALHDIVQVASYFNYVNRLADGLGVELETE
ncbi:MAG: peroxidase [bacterium]|nr:peroxidase [bacterium]